MNRNSSKGYATLDKKLYCDTPPLKYFLCPCMAINNVSVQYNLGLLPDIILLTQCYYHRGTRLNSMKMFWEVLSLQPMIPPKRLEELNVLTFSPLLCGMLRRSRCVQSFPHTTLFSTTDSDITLISLLYVILNTVFSQTSCCTAVDACRCSVAVPYIT